jgi:hypothetical protein
MMTHLYFIPLLFVLAAVGMAFVSDKGGQR